MDCGEVAEAMADALMAADSARVGRLLSQNWTHQQALDPRMCTEEMARLERSVTDAGALGGKAAGSGAGGCMFFLGPDDPAPVIEAARACGAQLLPVRWAMFGVRPVLTAEELEQRRSEIDARARAVSSPPAAGRARGTGARAHAPGSPVEGAADGRWWCLPG